MASFSSQDVNNEENWVSSSTDINSNEFQTYTMDADVWHPTIADVNNDENWVSSSTHPNSHESQTCAMYINLWNPDDADLDYRHIVFHNHENDVINMWLAYKEEMNYTTETEFLQYCKPIVLPFVVSVLDEAEIICDANDARCNEYYYTLQEILAKLESVE